ncbi:MAG: tetratricopeptide repeat protein [Treponema sp.]|uniref:tetratricopeptide repeat protein n=1 Tax=Treponema sp. TaxID=166 RepID=UPI0025F35DF6|nr:tetratricopeptide repeat protein [Treponema sp.]MBQ8681039.1 tetratricopeptide repeat protein [Treponema sp.]
MSDVNTMLSRAKSALLARDYTLASKIYKNLIFEEPDNISYKMELGNLYVKAGKDDQALTIFNQIVKADSENLDALIAISGIYRRQKKYDESVAVLEQALVVCESNPKSRAKISYNLGFTYRQMGNYEDAINCFEEVVEENPSDVLANNHLGAIYALQGNHIKAIEAYQRGLKYDSNHPILQFNIAKSYAEIGENQKALSFYEGALRAKPGWTDAIEAYADLLLDEDKVNEADEVVSQALKLSPDDVKIHTAKGNVFTRQSIYENAELEYKKALTGDDSYKNALTGLANSLENQGKIDEAVDTIVKAEQLNPNDTEIMKQSAHIHISAKQLDYAYDKISKLQEIDDNDVQTMNLLGQYYIVSDEAQKAEDCFANIKKIDPNYNDLYRDWAERFIQKGDEERAEPYLQAAIQKNPTDAQAMLRLGELYEKQNQMGKALQFYKKASSADSFNQLSKNATARILGDDESLVNFSSGENESHSVDYDSLFSGEKISSDFVEESLDSKLDAISDSGEISLANDDSQFSADFPEKIENPELENPEIENPVEIVEEMPAENEEKEDFNFEQFGMEKLADTPSGVEDVDSVANLLETNENALGNDDKFDFDELIDDGAPLDEEDALEPAFTEIPDGSDYIEVENSDAEVETEQAAQKEISNDSLDLLEEQIKRAAELAEKANYAAESAWKAAAQVADAAQATDILPVQKKEIIVEEPEIEEESIPEETDDRIEEAVPTEEELNAEEELADSDLLTAEELLTEDDIADAEGEDDDFLEDIPDYLTEEEDVASEPEIEEESLAESEETVENSNVEDLQETESEEDAMEEVETTETETPQVDDLTLRRAIDMLPSIIAAIEDRSLLYRFRSFLSMFKTLREMLEYLPTEQRREFMTSRNRLLLDYVISKLSGKPGLYATTKALIRSGLIHENPEKKASEKEGIELVKEVLADLRSLSEGLEDDTLREVLNAEADSLEKNI